MSNFISRTETNRITMRTILPPALTMIGIAIVFSCCPVAAQFESSTFAKVVDGRLTLMNCSVEVIGEPLLAAGEAGRLTKVPAAGQRVTKDEVVAETDSAVAQYQERIAYFNLQAEKIKLESDIEEQFARKQAQVAEAAYRDAKEADDRKRGAISANLLRQRKFEAEAGLLRVEKAAHDMKISEAAARIKLEEMKLAKKMVSLHQIVTPVSGIVSPTPKPRQLGEWVNPGDPIAQVTQTDQMRVVGHLELRFCSRKEAMGKSVVIRIPTKWNPEDGTAAEFVERSATISYVGMKIDDSKAYAVWADVDNSDDLLQSGYVDVEMVFADLP